MSKMRTIKAQGAVVTLPDGTSKADWARALLDKGVDVGAVSKVVPMAYSQAHSIAAKMKLKVDVSVQGGRDSKVFFNLRDTPASRGLKPNVVHEAVIGQVTRVKGKVAAVKRIEPPAKSWGELPPTGRPSKKPAVSKSRPVAGPRIGKLRIPGLPRDTAVGECANCGHQLLVRPTPTGYVLIHTGISAEEHLAVTQFCQAVPRSLMA